MVRNYPAKRAPPNTELLRSAQQAIQRDKKSLREASKMFNVNRMTLKRFIEHGGITGQDRNRFSHTIFTQEEETELSNHIKDLDNRFHGISSEKVCQLAYEYASLNDVSTPKSWTLNKKAGKDWLGNFMKRNKLSIRVPEATSIARQTGFNRAAVESFYDNLKVVMDRYGFSPQDIYNLDETGVTTVQKPRKVVSSLGKKQVGASTSQERGELVTMCCAINASGTHIPPFFIFPRVRMKDCFLNGAPPGSHGAATSSGYMNSEIFTAQYLPFFIKYTRCSKEKPVLLILDNHISHCSLGAVELCRSSGVILLTLPPHCSHRLQPLDRSVFGPVKTYFNSAVDDWTRTNPGRAVTIYEMGSLGGIAFTKAMSTINILSGFSSTGIFPIDRNIFEDHEFLPSSITDRPLDADFSVPEQVETPVRNVGQVDSSDTMHISPNDIIPLPKAGPRNKPARKRNKLKSSVLTDTPPKRKLEEERQERDKRDKYKCPSKIKVTKKERVAFK